MIQLKLAFLDEEEAYLEKLQGYLIRKKENFFKVRAFTRAEKYLECAEQCEFDAVVMTEGFLEEPGRKLSGRQILLSEGRVPQIAEDLPSVAKYQSAEKLFAQISALLWRESNPCQDFFPERAAELIGIYSPVHCENQILFSMAMAQMMSEKEKVLYVNLMEHCGFYGVTGEEVSEDVGDLIYGMMETEYDFTAGLHRIRRSYMDFDYIPPAVNPEHLSEISKEQYERLMLELKNRSGYDVVVIDFGNVFLGFAEMLPILERLYCLGRENPVGRHQMDEFLEYLGREGRNACARLKKLLLPGQIGGMSEENPVASCLYGELGDFIRGCLYGGEEIE